MFLWPLLLLIHSSSKWLIAFWIILLTQKTETEIFAKAPSFSHCFLRGHLGFRENKKWQVHSVSTSLNTILTGGGKKDLSVYPKKRKLNMSPATTDNLLAFSGKHKIPEITGSFCGSIKRIIAMAIFKRKLKWSNFCSRTQDLILPVPLSGK